MEENKNKIQKKKFIKTYIITSIVSAVIGFGIFSIFVFAAKNPLSDGFLGAAIILMCSGALCWVAHEGFFDFVSYGFKQLGSMMFSKEPNKNNSYQDYQAQKREIRKDSSKYFVCIMIVGLLYFLGVIIIDLI